MQIIDLSIPLRNQSFDPAPQQITYQDHSGKDWFGEVTFGMEPDDFDLALDSGLASESVTLSSHAGTHVDAPYHFGAEVGGAPARTIDQVPLEWCYGDGVLLDFSHCHAGYVITPDNLHQALGKIEYVLKPTDIVLIRTGADERFGQPDYFDQHCGLGAEALDWLLARGIRTLGTDAFSLDTSIPYMVEALKSGHKKLSQNSLASLQMAENAMLRCFEIVSKEQFFPVHLQVGRQREHIHAEKLANLNKLPRPHGFKVAMFPVKIEHASGAWARVVAIFEDS